ncbi:MAG: hypothetical protein ABI740_01490 [Alphaproteobacteria bacterium]
MTALGGRDLFEAVAQVLWEDWDPIGAAVPADEYDSYVPEVVRLLQAGASRETLADRLRRTALEAMSCTVSEEQLAVAVERLMTL